MDSPLDSRFQKPDGTYVLSATDAARLIAALGVASAPTAGKPVAYGADGSARLPAKVLIAGTDFANGATCTPGAIHVCDSSITALALPASSTWKGEALVIVSTAASPAVVVTPNGAETVNGAASKTLSTQYQQYSFTSVGATPVLAAPVS